MSYTEQIQGGITDLVMFINFQIEEEIEIIRNQLHAAFVNEHKLLVIIFSFLSHEPLSIFIVSSLRFLEIEAIKKFEISRTRDGKPRW